MPAPLVLVDGSSYLYRAFHALPPLSTKDGRPVGAIRGVISMLNKLADSTGAIRQCYRRARKTFRDEMYAKYKANREKMPEELSGHKSSRCMRSFKRSGSHCSLCQVWKLMMLLGHLRNSLRQTVSLF